jgi:hypothetical protein
MDLQIETTPFWVEEKRGSSKWLKTTEAEIEEELCEKGLLWLESESIIMVMDSNWKRKIERGK